MAEDEFEDTEDKEFEDDAEIDEDIALDDDLDEDIEDEIDDEFEDDVDVDVADEEDDEDDEDDDDDDEEEGDEALDELEAEELELLDDEMGESLLVDEAAEMRAFRREELSMNVDAQSIRSDEFVCQSCYLVKRMSQLANKRKMYCLDCAS